MLNRKPSLVNLVLAGVAITATAVAIAQQPSKDAKPGQGMQPPAGEMPPLPPGWTPADMQACEMAGTPGKMHEHLMKGAGTWHGKSTMWMAPGAPPMTTDCTSTISGLMDGRFIKCEYASEIPGMGPFNGMGIFGYDNVAQKFQCCWIDNCGTMMAFGNGTLSPDGTTMTWTYTYTCPINKKPTTMREVQKHTSENGMTSEMFSIDPKSGKEYKMMWTEFTRKN